MRIALATPMKPIDDPLPSGDRTMARLIVAALEATGHEVVVATRFRAWQRYGDTEAQRQKERAALEEADRIAAEWRNIGLKPDVFVTYHLYHKAPDWIGPCIADAFHIPYVIIEASRAPKRQIGEWAYGFAAADKALGRADMVAALHKADAECLRAVVDSKRLAILPPFLDAAPFQAASRSRNPVRSGMPRLLAVGMMREGDKERSYEVLAQALELVEDLPWHLTVVGDGPARQRVLSRFAQTRISATGEMPAEAMPAIYADHDILAWPAIREAFGFVFLEAQASGLCVVGGDTFGVPDIVAHGVTGLLSAEGDVEAFATNLRRVLDDADLRNQLGQAARKHIAANHSLKAGAKRLQVLLDAALRNHAGRVTQGE